MFGRAPDAGTQVNQVASPVLSLTSFNPTVTFDVTVAQVASPVLSLTSFNPTVNFARTIAQVASPVLSLTSFNPTVTFGVLVAQVASPVLTLVSFNPTVTFDVLVAQVSSPVLVLTSFNATVVHGAVPVLVEQTTSPVLVLRSYDADIRFDIGPPMSQALTIFPVTPAQKITKRRRLFNKNVSSIQAGIEAESETSFFDRLVGKQNVKKTAGPRGFSDPAHTDTEIDESGYTVEPSPPGGTSPILQRDEVGETHGPDKPDTKVRQDIRELQYAVRDIMEAIEELQKLQLGARILDPARTNLPRHGEPCELLDGQFLHITSDGSGALVPIVHGLRRIPQGAIFIRNSAGGNVFIEGVGTTIDVVYAAQTGASGDFSIFILF